MLPDDQPRSPLRRIATVTAGILVVIAGVLVSPLPGPGLSILGPIGVSLIATEFAWVRRWSDRLRRRERRLRRGLERRVRPIPTSAALAVIILYWVGAALLADSEPWPDWLTWSLASIGFLPVGYLCDRICSTRRRMRSNQDTTRRRRQSPSSHSAD